MINQQLGMSLLNFFKTTITFFILIGLVLPSAAADFNLEQVKKLRLRGELEEAKQLLGAAIDTADTPPDQRIEQHLEMARVLDRIGLHKNTRPVVAALTHIDLAADLLNSASRHSVAAVELAYSDYHYRAEMIGRQFPKAEKYARRAIALFAAAGDGYGQADSVHRLGLIEFQRRNLDAAELHFIESLRLDIAASERTMFRGEYERHIGFVVYQRGEVNKAVQHFERSLQARRDAGAIDASLFAAISLAAALIETDRRDEAMQHLDYASDIAQRIKSDAGLERIKRVLAQLAAAPESTE